MIRYLMCGFIALLTVAAVSLVIYGLFAFIGMESDVSEWHPLGRFFLVALSVIIGGCSCVATGALYLDLTEKPKGKT